MQTYPCRHALHLRLVTGAVVGIQKVHRTPARAQVPWGRLKCVETGKTMTVAGVRRTFLDAKHYLDAVMILLETPGGLTIMYDMQ